MNIQKATTLIKKDADTRGNEGHFVGLVDGMSNACVMNSDAEAQNSDALCIRTSQGGRND